MPPTQRLADKLVSTLALQQNNTPDNLHLSLIVFVTHVESALIYHFFVIKSEFVGLAGTSPKICP
ncbi:hypothetical protein B0189_02600 [Moraxella cuniculi]|nr:hypothetical protein B0189_02600 [Moraxella cuniculi]